MLTPHPPVLLAHLPSQQRVGYEDPVSACLLTEHTMVRFLDFMGDTYCVLEVWPQVIAMKTTPHTHGSTTYPFHVSIPNNLRRERGPDHFLLNDELAGKECPRLPSPP